MSEDAPTSTRSPMPVDTYEELYEHAPCGYLSTRPDGRIERVNHTLLAWTGHRRDDVVDRLRFADMLTVGGRIYHETHFAPLIRMQGSVRAMAFEMLRADGTPFPVLVDARLFHDSSGAVAGTRVTVVDASDRKQYERELLNARRRAERLAERLQVLEQVVADLSAVASQEGVARVVAASGVSAWRAAVSEVWLLDPATGDFALAALSGREGPVAQWSADRRPFVGPDDLHATDVVTLPGEDATADARVVVPLAVEDRSLGVLLLRLPGRQPVEEAEHATLRTLGRQAGQALQRARLYEAQRTIATTLQRSMLPAALPADPRASLVTVYRPAVDALEVGGDWYDAFRVGTHGLAVVVGDVVGRGLHAAAAMGQLRSAVRALATREAGPAALLRGLDAFVEDVAAAESATMAYVEVDLRDGSTRFACAGHPPPVLLDGAGSRLLWDGRSAPLGAHFGTGDRPEAALSLEAGARLVLYTDGLVERRERGLDVGLDRLVDVLARHAGRTLDDMVPAVADVMLRDERYRDDVCVLALGFRDSEPFAVEMPADRSRISGLRQDLAVWLAGNGVVGEELAAVVLACSEAVANAVEHGYDDDGAGVVEVLGILTGGALTLRVRDRGRWRPRRPDGDRGRGLSLIERLAAEVSVERADGTTVLMRFVRSGES